MLFAHLKRIIGLRRLRLRRAERRERRIPSRCHHSEPAKARQDDHPDNAPTPVQRRKRIGSEKAPMMLTSLRRQCFSTISVKVCRATSQEARLRYPESCRDGLSPSRQLGADRRHRIWSSKLGRELRRPKEKPQRGARGLEAGASDLRDQYSSRDQ